MATVPMPNDSSGDGLPGGASPAQAAGVPTAGAPLPPGTLRRLWFWLALAPVAWAAHEGVSYVGAFAACRAGGAPRLVSIPASLVALVLVGLATAGLARGRGRYPHADRVVGEVRRERAAFLALFGGVLAAISLAGVLMATAAAFVEACR